MQFINIDDEYPDWHDNGRKVEVVICGNIMTGEVCIDDVIITDDGEEPLIKFLRDDGESIFFSNVYKYRFIG